MHYTSIENIHKVIDPLFLDDLRAELDEISNIKRESVRKEKAKEFQEKLASLTFLDPASGSGNFLTETYISLRKLENEAISIGLGDNMLLDLGDDNPIKVSIQQFYGIEINDFAVKVAKTALWIAEARMYNETKDIISVSESLKDFLPLETYENIVEGNALRIDWEDVLPKRKCNYIIGNPPFLGAYNLDKEQKSDRENIWGKKGSGILDYVSC